MDNETFKLGLMTGMMCLSQLLQELPEEEVPEMIEKFKISASHLVESEIGMPAEDVLTRMQPFINEAVADINKQRG